LSTHATSGHPPSIGAALLTAGALAFSPLTACLPGDTRPTPGETLVTASADDAIQTGIPADQTADGWTIQYQRFLVSIGDVQFGGDACNEYSDASYTRILDLRAAPSQKVSDHYALGHCSFSFSLQNPGASAVLGANVSADDALFLRTPLDGPLTFVGRGGISVYVEGLATRGAESEHFAWPYRWQADYGDCGAASDGSSAATPAAAAEPAADTALGGLDFVGGQRQTIDLSFDGSALFRDSPDPAQASLRFEPFASADRDIGNADGEITLDELGSVLVTSISASDGYQALSSSNIRRVIARLSMPPTLEDYLYVVGFPTIVRYPNGACAVDVRTRLRAPDD
jgi:hypothetical protein